jgi:hypothetical protein
MNARVPADEMLDILWDFDHALSDRLFLDPIDRREKQISNMRRGDKFSFYDPDIWSGLIAAK